MQCTGHMANCQQGLLGRLEKQLVETRASTQNTGSCYSSHCTSAILGYYSARVGQLSWHAAACSTRAHFQTDGASLQCGPLLLVRLQRLKLFVHQCEESHRALDALMWCILCNLSGVAPCSEMGAECQNTLRYTRFVARD
jgi:hypothetical protein